MNFETKSPRTSHTPRPAPPSPRRTDILEAALACFNRLGYANATIADVRRESSASVGSIYHHFGDKEGIAGALYVEALRRYQANLLEKITGSGSRTGARTARGLVRGIVIHSIDWMIAHSKWSQYLFEMRRTEGVAAAEPVIRRETAAFFAQLSARMKAYIEKGEIRDLPMEVTGALLVGPAQELVRHWQRVGVPKNVNRVRDELAEAAWRSLRASEKTCEAPGRKRARSSS
jgi:AcrR family transcriptional regulator